MPSCILCDSTALLGLCFDTSQLAKLVLSGGIASSLRPASPNRKGKDVQFCTTVMGATLSLVLGGPCSIQSGVTTTKGQSHRVHGTVE